PIFRRLPRPGQPSQLCGEKTPDADHTAFRAMQETVIDEFPLDRILTPREVRGDYETLAEAGMAGGWPLVDETRGKVLFIID
ncbi:unnamed protein product, partial [Ectocarpus sp. 8 AP-2014]